MNEIACQKLYENGSYSNPPPTFMRYLPYSKSILGTGDSKANKIDKVLSLERLHRQQTYMSDGGKCYGES